jgi:cytochrome c oxidase subunit 2
MNRKILIFSSLIVGFVLLGMGLMFFVQNVVFSKENKSILQQKSVTKNFTLVAKQFSFEPGIIIVNKGDKVRLTIINQDVEHSFSLPAFNLDVNLPTRETKIVEFTADKVGTFTFRCWVYCGAGHSDMAGQLVVKGLDMP